jgi:hypothetical protein
MAKTEDGQFAGEGHVHHRGQRRDRAGDGVGLRCRGRQLKTFAKVTLDPGASTTVTLTLGERAFAYWDPGQPEWPQLQAHTAATLPQLQDQQRRTEAGWMVEPGRYDVVIANSAADVATVTTVELTAV